MPTIPREPVVTQRRLVGHRLHLDGAQLHTKYAFPFIDRNWSSPFAMLDLMGAGPRVLRVPIDLAQDGLHAEGGASDLARIESVLLADFEGLVHFDPWRVVRGISGVDPAWIRAVLATNLVHPFVHEGRTYRVEDLVFGAGLRSLTAVRSRDEAFQRREFRKGDLDLLRLRKPR